MLDLVITDAHTDRAILIHILKELKAMSLDLSNVNTALGKLSTDVDALISADAAVAKAVADVTATHQAQVEGLVPSIASISAKADAVLHPVPPEAPATAG